MKKLQTGISTNMDFIKAMKERGQKVDAQFPAETLRKQFDDLGDEVKVTFESTNETILAAVNDDSTESKEAGTVEELIDDIANPEVRNIKLTADMPLEDTLTVDHDLTIDGGGNTVSAEGKNVFKVLGDNVEVTLKNIKIETTGSGTGVRIGNQNLGDDKVNKVILAEDAEIVADSYGATVFGKNSEIDVYGKITVNSTDGEAYCISGNGAARFAGETTVNVYDGAVLTANGGFCIYQPQTGEINITGGTLTGDSVLGIKSGTVNVSGGTLTANGEFVDPITKSTDGKVPTGDVIAVEVNKSYDGGKTDKNININVSGGTFDQGNGYKIREANFTDGITINVTGEYDIMTNMYEGVNVYDDHAINVEPEEPVVEEVQPEE